MQRKYGAGIFSGEAAKNGRDKHFTKKHHTPSWTTALCVAVFLSCADDPGAAVDSVVPDSEDSAHNAPGAVDAATQLDDTPLGDNDSPEPDTNQVHDDGTSDMGGLVDAIVEDTGTPGSVCLTGNLKGYVCKQGGTTPWGGVRVYVIGTGCDGLEAIFSTVTDSTGYFSFVDLPAGDWDINVNGAGISQYYSTKISPGWTDLGPLGGATCDEPASDCAEGGVVGNLCPQGTKTFDSAGIEVVVKAGDCDGNLVEVMSLSAPSGDFKIIGLPVGYAQLLVGANNTANVWKSQLFVVEANKSTDLGQIGAISCEGKPPTQSGKICDDPKLPDCEVCDCVDNNGNGVVDEGCPYVFGQDICDCVDNDCDGLVDENCPGFSSSDGCDCADSDCDGLVDEDCSQYPKDLCNQKDDDCDGEVDEDCDLLDDCINPQPPFADCDKNQVPDQCPVCPALDVVFIVDTSGSMSDELDALCTAYAVMEQTLMDAGIPVTVELNALDTGWSCAPAQLITAAYPNEVNPPDSSGFTLNGCGATEENWAPAVAVVASNRNWMPDAVRVIVPISDEGPLCGDPVSKEDVKAMHYAAKIAALHSVVVSPIVGTGSPPDVQDMAAQLAKTTFGMWQNTSDPNSELVQFVVAIAAKACQAATDCNLNDVPDSCEWTADPTLDCNQNEGLDTCDILYGKSLDVDSNNIPDECGGL